MPGSDTGDSQFYARDEVVIDTGEGYISKRNWTMVEERVFVFGCEDGKVEQLAAELVS